MRFFAPSFRTRSFGHRQLSAGVIVQVGLFTWLTPALFGVLGIGVSVMIAPIGDFDSPWAVLAMVGGFLLFAPIYGILLVPLGLLIGAWAMRFGIAGWASAALFSVILPLSFGALFQWLDPTKLAFGGGVVMAPVVLIHAMTMWIATRHLCPQALFPEVPQATLS